MFIAKQALNSLRQSRRRFIGPGFPFVHKSTPFVCAFVRLSKPFICVSKKLSGFTVVELMIVLFIISILGALAVPAMGTFIRNQRISTQANDLVADLNFARNEALKRAANVLVCAGTASTCAGTDWETSRAVFVDANNDSQINAGDTVLRVRETLEGSNTLRPNPAVGNVGFNSTGGSTAAAVRDFRLCDNRGTAFGRVITLAMTGQVRVSTPPASCP